MAQDGNEGPLAALSLKLRRQSIALVPFATAGSTAVAYAIAVTVPVGMLRFGRRKPLGGIGAIIVVALILMAILAPVLSPMDKDNILVTDKYAAPGTENSQGQTYFLGSDNLGRDIFTRLMFGARISLYVALLSVGIGVTAGALLGVVSAFVGGKVDLVVQRVIDSFMAFPALILALGIMAVLGSSVNNVVITLTVIFIPGSSRVVRSQALAIKEMVYVEAAKAVGGSDLRIIFRHVLPNCMAPYIIFATANLGVAIVVEASLSFLGVGSPIDVPSWGGMLAVAGQKYIEVSPWLLIFPCIAISIVVFGFNLLGDALRDVLDPRLRGTL